MKVILICHGSEGYESSKRVLAVASTVEHAEQLMGKILRRGNVYDSNWELREVEVDVDFNNPYDGYVGKELKMDLHVETISLTPKTEKVGK